MFFAGLLAFVVGSAVMLFLSVVILFGIVGSMTSSEPVTVGEHAILKLDFSEDLIESPSSDPFAGIDFATMTARHQVTLYNALRAIETAKNDPRIQGIYLRPNGGGVATYAILEELREALQDFRQGGKFIIAYNETYGQGGYYLASVAEALLVYEALNQRDNGMTARELAAWAEEARYFVDAEFMVDDLESLRRGGRIPSTVAYAGAKLDVKPLLNISIEGKLALTGVARGRKKGIRQLAEYCSKRMTDQMPGRCVVIGNADCPKDAEALRDLLAKQDESITVVQHNIGATIGSHVGPGMVSISFWGGDRRENMSVADRIAAKIKRG